MLFAGRKRADFKLTSFLMTVFIKLKNESENANYLRHPSREWLLINTNDSHMSIGWTHVTRQLWDTETPIELTLNTLHQTRKRYLELAQIEAWITQLLCTVNEVDIRVKLQILR